RLDYRNAHATWKVLAARAGLQARSPSCRPRIHDLRHSFAVASLLDAYAAGQDAQARLALLATYLGHVDPAATYWYLSAAPELLPRARQRLHHHLRQQPSPPGPPPARRSPPPGGPARAKPARTPSPPTATPGGCCSATPPLTPAGSLPSWTWPTWARR